MYKITAICDKCKKEDVKEGTYYKGDFKGFELKIEQYRTKIFTFCPDCQKLLGVGLSGDKTENIQTVADRLMECIFEIASAANNG